MIETEHGSWSSFAALRKAYIDSRLGKDLGLAPYGRDLGWDPDKLHLSDLGMCPRMQMLRILGTEKKYETESKASNDALMYAIGYFVHHLTYAALDWAGALLDFEGTLPGLPEPWTGHYDAAVQLQGGRPFLWSGKTTRPNAFKGNYRYSFPKRQHELQDGGYLEYLPDYGGAVIEYIDRGGTNTPLTYWVRRGDGAAEVRRIMRETEAYYDRLPELPPVLQRERVIHYRKRNNVALYDADYVSEEYSWQCAWCDYHYGSQDKKSKLWHTAQSSPCKPYMLPAKKVAWRVNKHWHGERDDVLEWLHGQLQSYSIDDEEE